MTDLELLLLSTIGDDPKMIAYRPRLRQIAGSVTATILLQQILHRWKRNGFQPFYKYKEPCDKDDYRPGDSWCEELGFSRDEFDTAIKHIGQKVSRNVARDESKLVWYWTMPDRKTWYEVNYVALCNVAIPLYVQREVHVTKTDKPALPILYTKNTTEVTSEITTTTTRDLAPDSRRSRPAGPEAKTETALPEPGAEPPTPLKLHSPSTSTLSMRTNGQRTRQTDAAYNTICTAIESNGFGLMTPILAGTVNDLMDTYPTDWIVRALQVAVSSNVIRMSYVKGILANWQREGFSDDNRKYNRAAPGHHPPAADDERTQQQRAYNERLTRLMADQVNHAIDEAEAERQWAQLEADFPGFEYEKLP